MTWITMLAARISTTLPPSSAPVRCQTSAAATSTGLIAISRLRRRSAMIHAAGDPGAIAGTSCVALVDSA